MKTVNFFTLLLLAGVLSVSVSGCKKTPKSPTPIFGAARTPPRGGDNPSGIEGAPTLPSGPETSSSLLGGGNADGSTTLAPRPSRLEDYNQDRQMFQQEIVYFGFDKYNISPTELPKIQNVANYLIGNPNAAVLVEGHCDERGTPEYNRALGERRALSIREALLTLGIAGDRVHTTSFGEDRPLDSGTSEEAYARNRRGEFVLLTPKSGGSL